MVIKLDYPPSYIITNNRTNINRSNSIPPREGVAPDDVVDSAVDLDVLTALQVI